MEKTLKILKEEKEYTFNIEQNVAINYGLCVGADVLGTANPAYSGAQMSEIFRVQSEGLDDTLLLNPELGGARAKELRLGLEAGLDIKPLANTSMPLTNIQWLRRAMAKGIDIGLYPEFQDSITKIIKKYNELCGEEKPKGRKQCTLSVVRIKEEVNKMVVQYDDLEKLEAVIGKINDAHLDKVQRLKEKLYESDVHTLGKRVLEPVEQQTYFKIVKE
ncbi:hypothetical protein [Eubacterium limosum]|uniref:hypothetical protein n=1 Tax=Eubacterium limosum TaxID=1736 RepID=UPI00371A1D0F